MANWIAAYGVVNVTNRAAGDNSQPWISNENRRSTKEDAFTLRDSREAAVGGEWGVVAIDRQGGMRWVRA